jgi:CHAT domain-containing protein
MEKLLTLGMALLAIFSVKTTGQTFSISEPRGMDEVQGIQEKLMDSEIMIEYGICDSLLSIMAITRESSICSQQGIGGSFWSALKIFGRSMRNADIPDDRFPGQILYSFLITPVETLLDGKNRLIIIPSGDLSGLPFEAILRCSDFTAPCTGRKLHYLVEDFEIVYHCSTELWARTVPMSPAHEVDFVGFSPAERYRLDRQSLPSSRMEIRTIKWLFSTRGLTARLIPGSKGGKEQFMKNAPSGKIVHLATHYLPPMQDKAGGGFLFPGIDRIQEGVIADGELLSLDEIGDLGLQTDLLVLNACQTMTPPGKKNSGINLIKTRLISEGVRNILFTLWNVTDPHARDFMICFYSAWLSGKTYSAALRDVKMRMISRAETSLPAVWAPYVLTGR